MKTKHANSKAALSEKDMFVLLSKGEFAPINTEKPIFKNVR